MAEVRLRKWPAGRVSQLKLFLGHLEQAVGVSLAAQVEQSPRRKFSEFVPKIVSQDIDIGVSYKEIRVTFETPRGVKNLLFYEYQISATEGFYNFDQFHSPETQYLWSNLNEGTQYYIRIRVVTKDGDVGPWSDVEAVATPYSQAYGLYDGEEREERLSTKNNNPWVPIYEREYQAIGGKAYYAIDYDIQVTRDWGFSTSEEDRGNIEWSDCEFRWMENVGATGEEEDYVQKGQQFFTTSYATNSNFGVSGFYSFKVGVSGYTTALENNGTWVNAKRGTFVQKFSTMEADVYSIRLEGRVVVPRRSSNDFYPYDRESSAFQYYSDSKVTVKNFNIFETLVQDD
jgi:hypothetical protein